MGSKSGGVALKALVGVAVVGVVVFWLFAEFFVPCCDPKEATCISNMKQLGLALMQYTQDYNGAFPPSKACVGSDISNRQAVRTIVGLLDPYLGRRVSSRNPRTVWHCPAQRGHGLDVKAESDESAMAGTIWPLHYACNMNLLRPMGGVYSHYRYLTKAERAKKQYGSPDFVLNPSGSLLTEPIKMKDVEDPPATWAILEWHQTSDNLDACIDAPAWDRRREENVKSLDVHPVGHPPERGGLNVCYADGHAKWQQVWGVKEVMFYPDEKLQR